MASKAILILENIWCDLNQQNGNQATVLPFFEGLSRLNEDVQIYYMTFTDANSFEKALNHLLTAPQERLFIYVASHGYGARLANTNFSNISSIINIAVIEDRGRRVEGVIFGACEIGGAQNDSSLELLHWKTGIAWVLAYKNMMDWMPGTLIDLSFMKNMMQLDVQSLNDRKEVIAHAVSALRLFNPIEKIGLSRTASYSDDAASNINLKDAIRFLVKPRGQGNIFQDDTDSVIAAAYP